MKGVTKAVATDSRQAVRIPPTVDQGTLAIGSRRIACRIVDESAGGFLIIADRMPKVLASKSIQLISDQGRTDLRIVWRREVSDGVRVGLQRIPESLSWKDESAWPIWVLAATILCLLGCSYLVGSRASSTRALDRVSQVIQRVRGKGLEIHPVAETSGSTAIAK